MSLPAAAAIVLVAALAVGCSGTKPQPPAPGSIAAIAAAPPPPEPPAVVMRVKQVDGKFVAEVVDVRPTTAGAPAPDAETRRQAVQRVQSLLRDRVRVVDPAAQR